eukprot:157878_1
MSNYNITEEQLLSIKSKYDLPAVKAIAKANNILLSGRVDGARKTKKWADLIREIFYIHGTGAFPLVQWNPDSSSDDDDDMNDNDTSDDDDNMNGNGTSNDNDNMNGTCTTNKKDASLGHCFNVRINSDTMNAAHGYETHRRLWENNGMRIAAGILTTLIGVLENEGVEISKPASVVQFTVCRNAPTQPMSFKQLPPETDAKYNQKRSALIRNQRDGIMNKLSNVCDTIKGGGMLVLHDTLAEAEAKTRGLTVGYAGTFSQHGTAGEKNELNSKILKYKETIVERQQLQKNKGKKVVSVVEAMQEELEAIEQDFKDGKLEAHQYYKARSDLLEKKMLLISSNNNNVQAKDKVDSDEETEDELSENNATDEVSQMDQVD